jgi:hypothetical protein
MSDFDGVRLTFREKMEGQIRRVDRGPPGASGTSHTDLIQALDDTLV